MNGETRLVSVGLGELKTSRHARDVLIAYGLGSCVGVGMCDPAARVGGLLHAMLPERNGAGDPALSKYADTGVSDLLDRLIGLGAARRRLIVCLVGGANMLTVSDLKRTLNIGERNVAAARARLATLHLPLHAQLVGGTVGRTMRVYIADGRMTVRVMGGQEQAV